jgi:cation diffusion facilitator family transporter
VRAREPFHLPEEKERDLRRAERLEWITIGFMATAAALLYATMGGSQALKTAFVEDVLSIVPPAAFLIAKRVERRDPDADYPYGRSRSISIAFLCTALVISFMGAFLLWEALSALARREHPNVGMLSLFGWQVWHGWVMIAALVYSSLPPVVLGRMKQKLASRIHDKALHADAEINRADWLTGIAAMAGVIGIGMGIWWADAAAAAVIAVDILRDGAKSLAQVTRDLMDHRPMTVDRQEPDPLPYRVRDRLRALPWVADADVRLREEGHLFTGEAFVVPRDEAGLLDHLERARREVHEMDWRLYDVSLVPLKELRGGEDGRDGRPGSDVGDSPRPTGDYKGSLPGGERNL